MTDMSFRRPVGVMRALRRARDLRIVRDAMDVRGEPGNTETPTVTFLNPNTTQGEVMAMTRSLHQDGYTVTPRMIPDARGIPQFLQLVLVKRS